MWYFIVSIPDLCTLTNFSNQQLVACADPEGVTGGPDPPLENEMKDRGFLSAILVHATKSALNPGPSSARQRDTISMEFRWRADHGPRLVVF